MQESGHRTAKASSFKLRFPATMLDSLAARYTEAQDAETREEERHIVEEMSPQVRSRGFYTPDQFVTVCRWKSLRPRQRYEAIPDDRIVEATRLALAARDETLRIGILVALDGIGWPTASALLHFGHRDPYPILDFRALESLGVEQPSSYLFKFWWSYVLACRKLAERHEVDMRMLDRAMWQYSLEPS